MFDEAAFRQLAAQFRDHGHDYAALGLTSDQAAHWANRGFLPSEVGPWLAAGFDPDTAARHADAFRGPAEGPAYDNRRKPKAA
ncbi:hypothetical protein [Micromonospora sp. NBC_00421]|uniref:hypothetical protein n=1 Tax=Micromonospora sp. NBC_00421 TaxID=2975976 RepID=UPI002E233CDF